MKVCSPLHTSSLASIAARIIARHSDGSFPPCGATPINSAVGFLVSPSATVDTTGISPPKPSTSCAVCPARRESMTATTRSGV